jgi:WD40 repeat protein/tRNA A-37 threonylcarbamoyl transferase component Bud32
MSVSPACPDPEVIHRFALGRLSEEQSLHLEEHVGGCARCASLLRATDARADELVRAIRHKRRDDPISPATVEALLPLLRAMRPPDETQAAVAGKVLEEATLPPAGAEGEHSEACLPMGFLDPPEGPGELGVLGGYRVKRILGAGGMGMVLLAEDPRLHRQLAIKVIQPHLAANAAMRERFLHEARAVAAIEHDNIVAIHRADEQHGTLYLAMPLLRGESLERRLARSGGPLPLREVLQIGREIAAGLAAAHARGILHRDVKPANVWVETRGDKRPACQPEEPTSEPLVVTDFRIKLLDFGLARRHGGEEEPSRPGVIEGTPAYMAPEQARGQEVDARADLFSLGCVMYRAAAGKPPFAGKDTIAVLASIACDTPTPPESVPPDLSRLILRLLAKSPADRPGSAQAVVEAIEAIERKLFGPRLTRRRWLLLGAAGGAGLAGAAVWYFAVPAPVPPPAPVRVLLDLDEPDRRVVVTPDEGEALTVDLARDDGVDLLPGSYELRPARKGEKRTLLPGRITVKDGEKQRVKLRLVGEIRQDAEHTKPVWSVALSPVKGSLLSLAASDWLISLWDAATDKRPVLLRGHQAPVRCVAFSPDGKLAVSGSGRAHRRDPDCSVRVWDLKAGKEIDPPIIHDNWIVAVALSPDGQLLGWASVDGSASLWERSRRAKRVDLNRHDPRGVHSIGFAPDSKRAVTAGSDGLILIWDVKDGKILKKLIGHDGAVRAAAFSPTGDRVASAGDDGTVRVWDAGGDGARPPPWKGHRGSVLSVAWTPDGSRLISGGSDGTVRVWPARGGEPYVLKGHTGAVYTVACAADGRRALSGGADHTVRLWELPD